MTNHFYSLMRIRIIFVFIVSSFCSVLHLSAQSGELPADFPVFIDTGKPELDAENYDKARSEWIEKNKDSYLRYKKNYKEPVVTTNNTIHFQPIMPALEKAKVWEIANIDVLNSVEKETVLLRFKQLFFDANTLLWVLPDGKLFMNIRGGFFESEIKVGEKTELILHVWGSDEPFKIFPIDNLIQSEKVLSYQMPVDSENDNNAKILIEWKPSEK